MTARPRDISGLVILAERNSHIRTFLAREFEVSGASVIQAGDGRALSSAVASAPQGGTVVLDLEIPLLDEGLDGLQDSPLSWLLVVHALLPDHVDHPALVLADAVVEKKADPADLLDTVAAALAARARGPEPGVLGRTRGGGA